MFHKIKDIEILDNMMLKVEFIDNVVKIYDVKRLTKKWVIFENLKNKELFRQAKIDSGGYGISWNDEIDIECNELWEHGKCIN